MDPDINHIIQQAIKGDKIYAEILLKRLNPLIFKNIFLYYEPWDPITEDLCQEGYMLILESLKDYDIKYNVHFLQYIKVKLYYFYKNYKEKDYKYSSVSIEDLLDKGKELKNKCPSQVSKVIKKEEIKKLYDAIDKLSSREQQVLFLYYFEGLSMVEIAPKLNLSYYTIVNTKNLAIQKLKKLIVK